MEISPLKDGALPLTEIYLIQPGAEGAGYTVRAALPVTEVDSAPEVIVAPVEVVPAQEVISEPMEVIPHSEVLPLSEVLPSVDIIPFPAPIKVFPVPVPKQLPDARPISLTSDANPPVIVSAVRRIKKLAHQTPESTATVPEVIPPNVPVKVITVPEVIPPNVPVKVITTPEVSLTNMPPAAEGIPVIPIPDVVELCSIIKNIGNLEDLAVLKKQVEETIIKNTPVRNPSFMGFRF